EEAETRNLADSLVYQTEKFLKDNGDKFTEGEAAEKKAEVEGELNSLKEALKGSNMETIKAGTEKLSNVSQQLGATLYEAEQAAGADAAGEEPHGHGDDVVDAEIVDEQK
ncbi:MAG: Hsp70 family protein, partial [Actinobacteria bacterium]|nr:Hsp70 family protein [Actinomycetota bacterium]